MPLTPTDRDLLQRCFRHEYGAWNDFVDRYLGLIYHVVHHTAYLRANKVTPEDVEDIAADVLLQIVKEDYAVLRQFRQESSLSAYLTVIARRICVHELNRRMTSRPPVADERVVDREVEERPRVEAGLEGLEEVQKLLRKLPAKEREVVRLFYLEGRTYEEISTRLHIPVNSIGPILNRAKRKLRGESRPKPKANGQPRGKATGEKKPADEQKPEA